MLVDHANTLVPELKNCLHIYDQVNSLLFASYVDRLLDQTP